mgnify:CR=1 FL=1
MMWNALTDCAPGVRMDRSRSSRHSMPERQGRLTLQILSAVAKTGLKAAR